MTKKTKHRLRCSRVEEINGREDELKELGDSDRMLMERTPIQYFLKNIFYAELNVPYSQIYLFGIQIIFEWDDHTLPLFQRKIVKIHHIGVPPD